MERPAKEIITDLTLKSVKLRPWSDLVKEYDPTKHPVMTDPAYKDKAVKGGIEKVTRIKLDLQRLATKRMTELTFGIPVKRTYTAETDGEKEIAKFIERILQRTRINSVNIERGKMLFAGCEVATLWYAVEEKNTLYGFDSPLKLRCKNYSPMNGDELYPLFDEMDDLIALSFKYVRTEGDKQTTFFDTFTKDTHIQWIDKGNSWEEEVRESIALGKIPAIYLRRPTPIWEDTSDNVYEVEWALSRNGNYLRKNSKPIFTIFSDEEIKMGEEKDDDFRSVFQYPQGGSAQYVTWPQATDALKFHIETITKMFFNQLQLPDMSYDSMKTTPMSGEARKMIFLDAQLKVTEESGIWVEALDREINVIKTFLKTMLPKRVTDIDNLQVETVITPYAISDEKDTIQNLSTATGGKPIISQREAVKYLGWSEDVDATMSELEKESIVDISQPTL
ncbi:MAG: phage portal protein [Bacteroidia bacterium]|nr:phage portal protein [Bacteroidia bacterium]